jgi:AraC-like DNA-binding protein
MPKKSTTCVQEQHEQSMIRSFLVAPLVRELVASRVPVDALLRRHGLSTEQLMNLYERVPLAQFTSLLEDAAERLERPFLGLEMGGQFGIMDLGPFSGSFICAPTLAAALNQLVRFQSSLQTNTLLEVIRGPETSSWRYRIQDPGIWPRRQDAEFALASFTTFIRELTGRRWRPLAVEFEHDITGRDHALRLFHNAPIYGNQPYNVLVIANADLDRVLRWHWDAAKQDMALLVERHMQDLLGANEVTAQSVEERARELVGRRLGRTRITIGAIAAEMSMSVRSLRRHLAQAGTSYREILQAHRRSAVEAILRADGQRLSSLARRLSYSDSGVLSRAFKGWTGVSPREYARQSKRSTGRVVTSPRSAIKRAADATGR